MPRQRSRESWSFAFYTETEGHVLQQTNWSVNHIIFVISKGHESRITISCVRLYLNLGYHEIGIQVYSRKPYSFQKPSVYNLVIWESANLIHVSVEISEYEHETANLHWDPDRNHCQKNWENHKNPSYRAYLSVVLCPSWNSIVGSPITYIWRSFCLQFLLYLKRYRSFHHQFQDNNTDLTVRFPCPSKLIKKGSR